MLTIKGVILLCLCGLVGLAQASDERVTMAESCAQIPSKLERLACFDGLFHTQASTTVVPQEAINTNPYPEAFKVAMESEKARQQGMSFISGHPLGATEDLWLTAPAVGALPPRPVLMLSCIDSISRVELMLPTPLKDGWALVGLQINGIEQLSQRWLSDDTGFIFRTGRGLPAIQVMKALISGDDVHLRSANKEIDGLHFDTRELGRQIKSLRQSCRW